MVNCLYLVSLSSSTEEEDTLRSLSDDSSPSSIANSKFMFILTHSTLLTSRFERPDTFGKLK